jgi:hypothetical protein
MILPGTYIEVRAEKLIVPGPISIGNVGIVGTARRGRLADSTDPTTVYTPANIGEARDIFGAPDAFGSPEESTELTLVRALELAYTNGAQRVFAVRVAESAATSATYTLPAATGTVTLTALAPGTGYNDFKLTTTAGTGGTLNVTFTDGALVENWRDVPAAVAEFVQAINGQHPTYDYRSKASTGGKSHLFTAAATGATGNVTVDQTATRTANGTNGAVATPGDYQDGLNALLNQDVHIVVLAGQDAGSLGAALIGHVENASTDLMKRERIGVIGSDPSRQRTDLVAPAQDEGRLVFVGPGIKVNDTVSGLEVTLPGSYAAAAVAGRISSLEPHFSPTNKTINAIGLETEFNGTELEQLLLNRVMILENRNGAIRIVRGITTSTNTAWSQLTTRRIVDYARFGTRAAANPFIGKLNNERVRQALKGSINTLLADMVDLEMLISYELDVTATREQQIRGIVQVTMVLRPTFSIDFIRVVMYLE